MDLTPLLYVVRATQRPLLFLLRGLLLAIPMIYAIATILAIGSVDLRIVLLPLPWRPLVSGFKKSSSGKGLDADVNTVSRPTTIFCFFMVISSTVLISLTTLWKTLIPGIAETVHVVS
jgi:hypothetical protein